MSVAVARAFADHGALDDVFDACDRCLATKSVQEDIKSYMGSELRRIAAERGLNVEDVSDVTGRALSSWTKLGGKQV